MNQDTDTNLISSTRPLQTPNTLTSYVVCKMMHSLLVEPAAAGFVPLGHGAGGCTAGFRKISQHNHSGTAGWARMTRMELIMTTNELVILALHLCAGMTSTVIIILALHSCAGINEVVWAKGGDEVVVTKKVGFSINKPVERLAFCSSKSLCLGQHTVSVLLRNGLAK